MWHRADSGRGRRGRRRKEEWRVKSEEERVQINFNWIQSNWMPGILLTTVSNAIKFNCKFIAGHSEYSPPTHTLTHSLSDPSSSEWAVSTQPPTRRTLAFKSSELLFIAHSHARSITPKSHSKSQVAAARGEGERRGNWGATVSAVFNYLVGCLICWHFWFGQTDWRTQTQTQSQSVWSGLTFLCLSFCFIVLY